MLARCPADLLACVDSNVCLATIGTSVTANLESLDLDDSRAIENLRTCIGTYGKRIPTSSAPSCVNRCREAAETCPFQSKCGAVYQQFTSTGSLDEMPSTTIRRLLGDRIKSCRMGCGTSGSSSVNADENVFGGRLMLGL